MAKTPTVGARELKTRLGAYLRQVRQGRTLIITDRGEPIAELRPLPSAVDAEQEAMQRMAREGWFTPATRHGPLPKRPLIHLRGKPISDTISEDREDRF
ncbi:MAG: type II toxin-antitoxin system Phd/YefM family antitoxin [Terriglobales bacterium]